MIDWLEQNKDWVLSGAGVAVITTVVGILSSATTYWIKNISDKKYRKELFLGVELKKYQIRSNRTSTDLTVAYKGHQYEHLCEYSVILQNVGVVAIKNPKIIVKFPPDCTFVDNFKSRTSQSIKVEQEVFSCSDFIEHFWKIERLEKSDQVIFTYLIDTDKDDQLDYQARDVDSVKIFSQGGELVYDTKKLIVIFAFFIASGGIPFLGKFAQAGMIILAIPEIIQFIESWRSSAQPKMNTYTNINNVTIQEGGEITIKQESNSK